MKKQLAFLVLLGFTALFVTEMWSGFIARTGLIFPVEFGPPAMRGIGSDMLIALMPAVYLALMAWLAGQLRGGIVVSIAPVSTLFAVNVYLLVSVSINAEYGAGVQSDMILYSARGLVIFTLVPFGFLDWLRRRENRR